jgi:uncharacterized damage-inducible protein DinB
MSIAQMLLPEFEEEMANTRKLLALIPEGNLEFKPHEKSMTLGRLAGHVAEMPVWAKTTMEVDVLDLQPGMQPFVCTSREQTLAYFDENVAAARTAIAGASDEAFAQKWTLKVSGKEVMSLPKYNVMRSMVFNHLVHHRAQLGVYLRLNNVEFPGMYGPSADEMKFWEAKG